MAGARAVTRQLGELTSFHGRVFVRSLSSRSSQGKPWWIADQVPAARRGDSRAATDQLDPAPIDPALAHENLPRGTDPQVRSQMVEMLRMLRAQVEAAEAGRAPARGIGGNALFNDADVPVRRLVRVPDEILKEFRKLYPASDVAAMRFITNPSFHSPQTHTDPTDGLWGAVDGVTMIDAEKYRGRGRTYNPLSSVEDPSAAIRRQRQRSKGRQARRANCPLSDEKGRVRIDFRNVAMLEKFISPTGKILPKSRTACTAKAQRKLRVAIKCARQMALLNSTKGPDASQARRY